MNEAKEIDNLNGPSTSSSSLTATENIHKSSIDHPLICGTDDVDNIAKSLLGLESNGKMTNIAILIPERFSRFNILSLNLSAKIIGMRLIFSNLDHCTSVSKKFFH